MYKRQNRRRAKKAAKVFEIRKSLDDEKAGPVTRKEVQESFAIRKDAEQSYAKQHGPLFYSYIAKCSTDTEERESEQPFYKSEQPVILDANGNKFLQSNLPKELRGDNIHRVLLYKSTNMKNACMVEAANQEDAGLGIATLFQGFGFGGRKVKHQTVHSVWLFIYPHVPQMLKDGRLRYNPKCFLFRNKEGPKGIQFHGGVPTWVDVEQAPNTALGPRRNPKWPFVVDQIQADPTLAEELDSGEEFAGFTEVHDRIQAKLASRKTEHGGYKHEARSKKLIGNGNKGKTVWNAGQERSEEDKAKISQGVLNRNNAEILEGLENYNKGKSENEQLTLDDVRAMKKQIKRLQNSTKKLKDPAKRANAWKELTEKIRIRNQICPPKQSSNKTN